MERANTSESSEKSGAYHVTHFIVGLGLVISGWLGVSQWDLHCRGDEVPANYEVKGDTQPYQQRNFGNRGE